MLNLDMASENIAATLETSPELVPILQELISLAHIKGNFSDGWCGELNLEKQPLTERDFRMLSSQAIGKKEWPSVEGMHVTSKYGRGWFTLNISCPVDSGIWEIFIDQSIRDLIKE